MSADEDEEDSDERGDLITVKCQCGHTLGRFGEWDDHGSIDMECPACKKIVSIHQAALSDPDWQEEDGTVIARESSIKWGK